MGDDDTRERENEKREAQEKQTEQHAPADREDKGDRGEEAVREVGPGGHFFATGHTLARYETAFYAPLVSDWRNFEAWNQDGAADATTRASALARQAIAEYEQPALDPAAVEAIEAFVARRVEEGGAPVN